MKLLKVSIFALLAGTCLGASAEKKDADEVLDRRARPVFVVEPEYPRKLKKQKVSGKVVLRCTISAEGRVTKALAVSYTHREFAEAAAAAVLRSFFDPKIENGVAVESVVDLPFVFSLKADKKKKKSKKKLKNKDRDRGEAVEEEADESARDEPSEDDAQSDEVKAEASEEKDAAFHSRLGRALTPS